MRPAGLPLMRFLFVLAMTAVAGSSAWAQQAASEAPGKTEVKLVTSNWQLNCRPAGEAQELLCEASQTVTVQGSGQTLLVAQVTPWKQEGAAAPYLLRFQLPHGLNIPAGVAMAIDDAAMPAPVIQTSNQAGIFARAPLDDALLAAMKQGKLMTVGLTALNGSDLTIPVSLNGFTAVFGKLQ